jgi:hypothetical protein
VKPDISMMSLTFNFARLPVDMFDIFRHPDEFEQSVSAIDILTVVSHRSVSQVKLMGRLTDTNFVAGSEITVRFMLPFLSDY